MFIGISVLLAVFFIGWAIVYQLGAHRTQKELARYLGDARDPQAVIPSPSAPSGLGPAPALITADQPSTGEPPAPQSDAQPPLADLRRPGVNYLHIDTLTWKDAERAVAYLNKNGVAAAAAPAKPIDPLEARNRNLPHIIYALDGVPSEQYKSSEHKRQELVDRVRKIGKKWQTEEKGPSDFGLPGWVKFKPKD
jgi:hypothetical protein